MTSATVTVCFLIIDRTTVALTMAGAAPVWNGNDERRPMLSTTTGNVAFTLTTMSIQLTKLGLIR
jgi:hypothetical protein